MKITRREISRIIKEEMRRALREESSGPPKASDSDAAWAAHFKEDCEKQAAGFKNSSIKKLAVDACVDSKMATRKSRKG